MVAPKQPQDRRKSKGKEQNRTEQSDYIIGGKKDPKKKNLETNQRTLGHKPCS